MKRKLCRFILIFLSPIFASAQITPDMEWFACTEAQECVIEPDPCQMREVVNKKFLGDYRSWRAEIQGVMGCGESDHRSNPGPQKLKPFCSHGRCSLPVTQKKPENIFVGTKKRSAQAKR